MNLLRKCTDLTRWLRRRAAKALRCSFCARDADQVARLVAGPSVYICDSCIEKCVAVLEQHGGFPPAPAADQDRWTNA